MMGRITYTDLLETVTENTGAPKQKILSLIKEHVNTIRAGLENDGQIEIKGLGQFEIGESETPKPSQSEFFEKLDYFPQTHVHFMPESTLRHFMSHDSLSSVPILNSDDSEEIGIQIIKTNETEPRERAINNGTQRNKLTYFWTILFSIAIVIFLLFWIWPRYRQRSQDNMTLKTDLKETNRIGPQSASESEISITRSSAIPGVNFKITRGDRLWFLSDRYYDNAYFWPYILQANSSSIPNPDFIEVGQTIFIPFLEGRTGELTPHDRENIAKGYFKAYMAYLSLNHPTRHRYLWVAEQIGDRALIDTLNNRINEEDRIRANQMKGRPLIQ